MKINKELLNSKDTFALVGPLINDEEQEHLIIIVVNSAMIAKSIHFVSSGTNTSVPASIKTITRIAILNNASGVILSHNHPTGPTTPSEADIEVTQQVTRTLNEFGIKLLDHIITGNNEYYSFTEKKLYKQKQ